jgi:hypothetical protein
LLEGFDYLGSFYALGGGCGLPVPLADQLHVLLTDYPKLVGSATMLEQGGLAVRLLGMDHHTMSQALNAVWELVHRQVLGYAALPGRK